MKLLHTLCLTVGLWSCDDGTQERAAYYRNYLGAEAGTLTIRQLSGLPVDLANVLDGRPAILNLWATWCPPCLEEMPGLSLLAQRGDFQVIALSTDATADRVKNYVARHENHFKDITVLHDPSGRAQLPLLGATEYPVTYLLNPQGEVIRIYTGGRHWHTDATVAMLKTALGEAATRP